MCDATVVVGCNRGRSRLCMMVICYASAVVGCNRGRSRLSNTPLDMEYGQYQDQDQDQDQIPNTPLPMKQENYRTRQEINPKL